MHDRINKLIFMKPNPILHRNPENFKGSLVAERRYVYSSTDHPYLLSPVGTACTPRGAAHRRIYGCEFRDFFPVFCRRSYRHATPTGFNSINIPFLRNSNGMQPARISA